MSEQMRCAYCGNVMYSRPYSCCGEVNHCEPVDDEADNTADDEAAANVNPAANIVLAYTAEPFAPGDRVIYVPMHAYGDRTHSDCERGEVSSVSADGSTVFVRFDASVSRLGWDGATAQACYPESLVHDGQEK